MARNNPLQEKQQQQTERRLNDLRAWYQDVERAERCGIDCTERRERGQFLEDFFTAILREYFNSPPRVT